MKQYSNYHYIALLLLFLGMLDTQGQSDYRWLVKAIDQNSTTLSAYQKSGEAQKMQNKTGLTLPNPEVDVSYFKVRHPLKDHRFDYSISQSFEFPTVYGRRKAVAAQQNELVDTEFSVYRADLISQAINTYLLWVYYSELGEVLEKQKSNAESIAASYQKAFEAGSIHVLDRNKAQVNATNIQKEYQLNAIEIHKTYQELLRYNRGQPFEGIAAQFPAIDQAYLATLATEDFLVGSNGELQSISKQMELSEAQEKLTKAERLPEFSVGYIQEQDIEMNFRGVGVGMTLPLWQKKNTTRAAKLKSQALAEIHQDTREQYAMRMEALQKQVSELHSIMNELQVTLSETRGLELLKKALDLKEITILEYLVEQSMYFELTQKYLESTLSFHVALAELNKWKY